MANSVKDLYSEKKDIVLQALSDARTQMDAIKKDSLNPFHKNKYAGLPAFIEATNNVLRNNGLIVTNSMTYEDGKNYIVIILDHIKSGQWIKSFVELPNAKGDCQGLGSAITYMRRYGMSALLNVCAEEDDDGQKACAPAPEKKKPVIPPQQKKDASGLEKIDELQQKQLKEMIATAGEEIASDVNKFLKNQYDNIKSWRDMPKEVFESCMRVFKINIEKKQKEAVAA